MSGQKKMATVMVAVNTIAITIVNGASPGLFSTAEQIIHVVSVVLKFGGYVVVFVAVYFGLKKLKKLGFLDWMASKCHCRKKKKSGEGSSGEAKTKKRKRRWGLGRKKKTAKAPPTSYAARIRRAASPAAVREEMEETETMM